MKQELQKEYGMSQYCKVCHAEPSWMKYRWVSHDDGSLTCLSCYIKAVSA